MENAYKSGLSAGLYRNGGSRNSRSGGNSAEQRDNHIADSLRDQLAAGVKALALHLARARAAQ